MVFSIFEIDSSINEIVQLIKFTQQIYSMKKLLTIAMFATALTTGIQACAQEEDKSKRPIHWNQLQPKK
jgi:hypothetical protein